MDLAYLIILCIIFFLVLFLPFLNKRIERNLEVFFFFMGSFSILNLIIFKGVYPHPNFAIKCLKEPLMISLACLAAGLLFHHFKKPIKTLVFTLEARLNLFFPFLLVMLLGLISSSITAIIASLILVEIIYDLSIRRKEKVFLCVISCFSIGLGATLTPIGEPLSTIAISKLKQDPHNADFLFLFRLLFPYVMFSIIVLGILAIFVYRKGRAQIEVIPKEENKDIKKVFIRSAKVYLFVLALLLLGEGFKLFVNLYVNKLSAFTLYFINISSSILDNATLTACEISPSMSIFKIKVALLSLLVSGGMLIPGNIPNIISAERLGIGMKEWAKFGIPIGIIFLVLFYISLFIMPQA